MLSIVGNQCGMVLHGLQPIYGGQEGMVGLFMTHSGGHRGMAHIGVRHGMVLSIGDHLSSTHIIVRSIGLITHLTIGQDMIGIIQYMEGLGRHLTHQVESLVADLSHHLKVLKPLLIQQKAEIIA